MKHIFNHILIIKALSHAIFVFLTCHIVKEKFFIPVDTTITVEDDSGTEVDENVFAELATMGSICFVIKESHDDSGNFKKLLDLQNSFHCSVDVLYRLLP